MDSCTFAYSEKRVSINASRHLIYIHGTVLLRSGLLKSLAVRMKAIPPVAAKLVI